MVKRSPKDRFLKFIRKTKTCWIYTGSGGNSGYGNFWDGSKITMAHRFSYRAYKGEIPNKMCVCHSCDNKSCVNPEHLWLGTQKQNLDDMYRKGRNRKRSGGTYPIGIMSHNAKLTKNEVLKIRNMYKTNNYSHRTLAKMFGVSHFCIEQVVKLVSYKNVK